MNGRKPKIPAQGYAWKDTPALNRKIWEENNRLELSYIWNLLQNSHHEIMAIIESHSDDELFERRRYKWTGSTSLAAYLISATCSHYDWAIKIIKRAKKQILSNKP